MTKPFLTIAAAALLVTTANAAEPTTARAWQAEVERRIDREMQTPATTSNDVRMAEVAMRFDAQGHFTGTTLRSSSGLATVDEEALRVARTIRYPVLPPKLLGRPQVVAMQIFFGDNRQALDTRRDKARQTASARAAEVDHDRAMANIVAGPDG